MDDDTAAAYLDRIGVSRSGPLDAESLRLLHRAHLLTVPFENLTQHLDGVVSLAEHDLVEKIVRQRRGGFCYELNGIFGLLLETLGAHVTLVGARVHRNGGFGPPLDHLALIVQLPDGSGPWLADVGYGEHSVYPLLATSRADQDDPEGRFRLADAFVDLTSAGVSPSSSADARPSSSADARPSSSADTRPSSSIDTRPSSSIDTRPSSSTDARPSSSIDTRARSSTGTSASSSRSTGPGSSTDTGPGSSTDTGPGSSTGNRSSADTRAIDVFKDGVLQYQIEVTPRRLSDFGPTCWWQQTSAESGFTRQTVCSRLTENGRITLTGRTLISTVDGSRQEHQLTSDAAVFAAYQQHFGFHLKRVPEPALDPSRYADLAPAPERQS